MKVEITVEILLICKIGFIFRAPKKDSNNDDYENFAKLVFSSLKIKVILGKK